jgi:hypothetical protein
VIESPYVLVTTERVPNWAQWKSKVLPRADKQLTGDGYILVFALIEDDPLPPNGDLRRRRYQVTETVEFQIASEVAFRRKDGGAFKRLKHVI